MLSGVIKGDVDLEWVKCTGETALTYFNCLTVSSANIMFDTSLFIGFSGFIVAGFPPEYNKVCYISRVVLYYVDKT